MNKKIYHIGLTVVAVVLAFATCLVLDDFPSVNAAIRVAEAELPQEPVYNFYADDSYQRYL